MSYDPYRYMCYVDDESYKGWKMSHHCWTKECFGILDAGSSSQLFCGADRNEVEAQIDKHLSSSLFDAYEFK